jgi:hypothetical protein
LNCEDVYYETVAFIDSMDINSDGFINMGDGKVEGELAEYMELCDYNNDGQLDKCEVHKCFVDAENAKRAEVCPWFGGLYCDCPFTVVTCDIARDCEEIENEATIIFAYYDYNMDSSLNP